MDAPDLGLDALLGPIGRRRFFDDYWEKEPLHVSRGNESFYAGLLSSADIEEIVAFTRPKFLDPGAFSDDPPRAKTFVQGWLAERQTQDAARYPSIDEVRRVYERGKTVIIMTMQQRWRPVAYLCRGLEAIFRCPVHANAYLTPRGAQGFDAHFDTHEVFVLQLEGTKQWRLYGSPRELPLVDERNEVQRDRLGPAREVELHPGDLLYIPRGFVHEAFTAEAASLHLTVGVNVFRWVDLLQEALIDLARNDRLFRESVPSRALAGSPDAGAEDRFRELLADLASRSRIEVALRRLGDQFYEQLPPLPGSRRMSHPEADDISPDSMLKKAPGLVCRVVEDGGWVVLDYPGGHVGGPRKILAALRFVAETDRFRVRDLPDDLGGEAKVILARRLLNEGVLRRLPG